MEKQREGERFVVRRAAFLYWYFLKYQGEGGCLVMTIHLTQPAWSTLATVHVKQGQRYFFKYLYG